MSPGEAYCPDQIMSIWGAVLPHKYLKSEREIAKLDHDTEAYYTCISLGIFCSYCWNCVFGYSDVVFVVFLAVDIFYLSHGYQRHEIYAALCNALLACSEHKVSSHFTEALFLWHYLGVMNSPAAILGVPTVQFLASRADVSLCEQIF